MDTKIIGEGKDAYQINRNSYTSRQARIHSNKMQARSSQGKQRHHKTKHYLADNKYC